MYVPSKKAGLKNNPTLTQPPGNYGTEQALGCFDPSAGVIIHSKIKKLLYSNKSGYLARNHRGTTFGAI